MLASGKPSHGLQEARVQEIDVTPRSLGHIQQGLGRAAARKLKSAAARARALLGTRLVWNVNSTACGGGVAEMLEPLVGYARGLGVNARWLVIEADHAFFTVTKRIHNHLHGDPGDGGALADTERAHYEAALRDNARALVRVVRPGDIVICHDPQTAGLVPALHRHGALVLWRCHVGRDTQNELSRLTWDFLSPYVRDAHCYIFTRRAFVPPQLDQTKVVVIPPSIDPLAPKNQPLTPAVTRSILVRTGILQDVASPMVPAFVRHDGSQGLVTRGADIIRLGPGPHCGQPMVVQVSRWDRLKDPIGVLRGFQRVHADGSAFLVLAGPNVSGVVDDPEGGAVLDDVFVAWRQLPHEVRRRVQVACLPMADRDENAAIVNALQRQATIVVQKSLYEGFGLTVAEAMWKGRPVVASAVGGIQDQIESETHGFLLKDPTDLPAFSEAIDRLLADRSLAVQLGENARQRIRSEYLFDRHLLQYLSILEKLLAQESPGRPAE
jgi:trehalose synthase